MDNVKLIDYLKGLLSTEDTNEVELWIQASPENRKCLERLYYVLFLQKQVEAEKQLDVEQALGKFHHKMEVQQKPDTPFRKIPFNKIISIAASFIIGIFLSSLLWWFQVDSQKQNFTVQTQKGEKVRLILPDNSKVWVNENSQLVYSRKTFEKKRNIQLEGEAYFEVAHDPKHPFIVNSKGVQSQVYGTKFNIYAPTNDEFVIATLLQGSIGVSIPDLNDKEYRLHPDQQITVDVRNKKISLETLNDSNQSIFWIEGECQFNQQPLSIIIRTLEKFYNVRFIFAREELKEEKFTCEFSPQDQLDDILNALQLTGKIHFKHQGEKIKIE